MSLTRHAGLAASSQSRWASAAVGASAIARTIGSVLLPRTSSQRSGQSSRRPSRRSAAASRKCASDRVERRRNLLLRQRNLRLHDLVARQLVGHRADRQIPARPSRPAAAPCRRNCRGPVPRAGSIGPPLPSPPKIASCASIASTTFASPTAERKNGTPCLLGQVLRHAAAGAIGDDRPRAAPQHMIDAQGQRVLLAQVAARWRRSRPAGRRRGPGRSRRRPRPPATAEQHAGQVLGRRFGQVGELAVGRLRPAS